jgi:hypothetical protein
MKSNVIMFMGLQGDPYLSAVNSWGIALLIWLTCLSAMLVPLFMAFASAFTPRFRQVAFSTYVLAGVLIAGLLIWRVALP